MRRRIISVALTSACGFAGLVACDARSDDRADANPQHAAAAATTAPVPTAPTAPAPAPATTQASRDPAPQPIERADFTIAILGDATRLDLLRRIADASAARIETAGGASVARVSRGRSTYAFIAATDAGVTANAAVARRADLVLLAVNAADGPTPVTREHALLGRQTKAPEVVVVLTNARLVDDPELIELEAMEVREILRLYVLPDDAARVMMDEPNPGRHADFKGPKGVPQIVEAVTGTIKKRPAPAAAPAPTAAAQEKQAFRAVVYVLADQEAAARNLVRPVDTGPATITFGGGGQLAVNVTAKSPIDLAGTGEVTVNLGEPLRVAPGDRFVFLRDDHIAAVGSVVPD